MVPTPLNFTASRDWQKHGRRYLVEHVLIDITRLLRSASNPRGTLRVTQAYLRHYGHKACAVIWLYNQLIVISPQSSSTLFSLLLSSSPQKTLRAWLFILKEIVLFRTQKQGFSGAFKYWAYRCEI